LKNLGDVYMAIFSPAAIGKPDSYVLIDRAKQPTAYSQNKGLDSTGDGKITHGECRRAQASHHARDRRH